ncbi:hypothetical protein PInf_018529 [Phytophthora infestans]|nr:hypothetical protein PInf_018529 [Phytophthora infestans]
MATTPTPSEMHWSSLKSASADVKEFLKIAFCCDVVEGYALSETAAGLCLASGDMPLGPHVGPPLARMQAVGTLSVIDRKKNIFKLSQGEFATVEKVEGVYLKSKYVAQLFAYGESLQSCLVVVVVPDPETAEAWGRKLENAL